MRLLLVMVALLLALALFSAVDLSCAWALDHANLGLTMRVLVALLPAPGNLILIGMVLRRIRKLDEFQKRLHFEAVVVGFLATGVIVFIYGFLQKAGAVSSLNTWYIWIFMALTYGTGYVIAVRHYR